jgi:hypothetical protein
MKTVRFFFIFHFAFFVFHYSFGQQYGWKNITANLPNFPRDTLILVSDTSIAMIRAMYFLDDLEGWITPNNGSDSCCILHTIDGGGGWEVLSTRYGLCLRF